MDGMLGQKDLAGRVMERITLSTAVWTSYPQRWYSQLNRMLNEGHGTFHIPVFAPSRVTAEDAMTMDFSFRGAHGCVTLFPNPEIRFKECAVSARWVLLKLSQGTHELGGQEVPVSASGILSFDTVRTYAPCNAGRLHIRGNRQIVRRASAVSDP